MNISKENVITMACSDGQLRPGKGIQAEVITMACSDGQLRPGKGIQAEKVKVKTLRKVA